MNSLKIFYRRKILLLLIIGIICFCIFLAHKYSYLLCNRIRCISLNSISAWREQEIYENNYSRYRALLVAPSYLIRIEKNSNLSKEDAENLILFDVMQKKGLFDDIINPYTGEISNKISCENRYKPEVQIIPANDLKVTYYSGWLNDRLQYGVCLDDQLIYKTHNALFYCSNQRSLYHLEFIMAIKDKPEDSYFLNQIQSIKCQNPLLKIGNIFP